jgi:hypothetical protein
VRIHMCGRNLGDDWGSALLAAAVKGDMAESLSLCPGRWMAEKGAKDYPGKVDHPSSWLRWDRQIGGKQ